MAESREFQRTFSGERSLLRALIDNLPDHIYIKDQQGRYVTDNIAHARFLGCRSHEEVAGKTVFDFFPAPLAQRYAADDDAVLASGQAMINREEPIVDTAGITRWVSTTKVPLHGEGGRLIGIVCVSRDISRRKRMEQEMAESRDFVEAILENIPNMIFVKDAQELRFIRFNKACEELLGYSRDELLGKNDFDFFPREEAEFFVSNDRAVLASQSLLDIPSEPIKTRRGIRYLHTKKIPLSVDGKPKYLLGISDDITERKAGEEKLREQYQLMEELVRSEREAHDQLKQAQAQMVQSEKLIAMGQLVAGVAHEINNPLAFVSNNVAVLQRDALSINLLLDLYAQAHSAIAEKMPEVQAKIDQLSERIDLPYLKSNLPELLDRTREGLRRIQQIVKDLRDFARQDVAGELAEQCDINAGIESTLNMVRGRARRLGIEVATDLEPLPRIPCQPAKLNQVILNLLVNALDACGQGDTVTVRTRPAGDRVQIQIIDTGSGIAPEVRDHIFDPFFTTKPQGQGTGLGLSISHGIILEHGGTIAVDSTPGKGTTFIIHLPIKSPVKTT